MSRMIPREKINGAKQRLSVLAKEGPQLCSLKEAIGELAPSIEDARRKGIQWSRIVETVNDALGEGWQMSERTIRQYYGESDYKKKAKAKKAKVKVTHSPGSKSVRNNGSKVV
ncbi:MAG: hypothetical protein AAGF01_25160 [Cyanobacteria bacterium P01_G01_bin.38]